MQRSSHVERVTPLFELDTELGLSLGEDELSLEDEEIDLGKLSLIRACVDLSRKNSRGADRSTAGS